MKNSQKIINIDINQTKFSGNWCLPTPEKIILSSKKAEEIDLYELRKRFNRKLPLEVIRGIAEDIKRRKEQYKVEFFYTENNDIEKVIDYIRQNGWSVVSGWIKPKSELVFDMECETKFCDYKFCNMFLKNADIDEENNSIILEFTYDNYKIDSKIFK